MMQHEVDKLREGTRLRLLTRVSFYTCAIDVVTENYISVIWVYGNQTKSDIIEKHSPIWSALEIISMSTVDEREANAKREARTYMTKMDK